MNKSLICILIVLSFSVQAQTTPATPGQYPQASQRLLKIIDIQEMDEPELKLMRNEIFARYGHIFKSADLKAHFESQSWYKPVSADVTGQLTDIEKKNADLIKRQEQRVRTTGEFEDFYELFSQAVEKDQMDKLVALAHLDGTTEDEESLLAEFRSVWSRVKEAVRTQGTPVAHDTWSSLTYWERNDGDTADYIEFQKIGPCWYITGFGGAG
ncbi:MAG TPA: YARHG domain-containing protein [Ohtaekwangia sp.]